jgi:hypothetical protein
MAVLSAKRANTGQALRLIEQLPALLVAAQDVLQRGGDEEVLLLEPQLLALKDVVSGVEHPGDVLGAGLGLDGPFIVAAIEVAQIELVRGLGRPQAQRVDGAVLVARNGRVVGQGQHVLGVYPVGCEAPLGVDVLVHVAVKLDAEKVAGAGNLPGVAIAQPGIGSLDLVAMDNALMEHAILVAQAVAVGGQRQGGQRVQEAGGEPSQTAVTEPRIPLCLPQVFELVAEFVHGLRRGVEQPEIHQAIGQGTSHEEFQRQVVDTLGIVGIIGVLGVHPPLDEAIPHGERQAEVGLPLTVHMLWQLCQGELEVGQELLPDGLGVQAIDILLLQILGLEDRRHASGYSRHATPLYIP